MALSSQESQKPGCPHSYTSQACQPCCKQTAQSLRVCKHLRVSVTPQVSSHPCTATASPLRLPLAHLIPVSPPPNLCHQPSHPGHCFWVHSYAWLLFCGPIYPFQARETFPKHPFGAKALHACESLPPWLATSCLGESRERRERHTALRWRNLQSLLRIPPHSSSFFIPSLCLLKNLLGKLDASKSLSPFPPPCSAKRLARGLKGSLGQPGSSQQP